MANFGAMVEDLRLLTMGNLTADTLKSLINRAHQQILESFDWTFLLTNTVINSALPKSAGTVTVSQGSPIVIGTGTAFTTADRGSFLWAGGMQGAPVPVQGTQGVATLTLSSPWAGPTLVNASYVLTPLYYLVEGALEIFAIRSLTLLDKLTREDLNDRDPARIAQGGAPATAWAPAPVSPDGSVRVELWPVCSDLRPYLIDYKRMAPRLVNDVDLPLCPYAVIEAKAARTAMQMLYASTGQQSYALLAQQYEAQYAEELDNAKSEDSKRAKATNGVSAPTQWRTFDAQFDAGHDMAWTGR